MVFRGSLATRGNNGLCNGYRASVLCDEKSSGGWVHNNANILNTPNCTLRNGKFCYVYFTMIFSKSYCDIKTQSLTVLVFKEAVHTSFWTPGKHITWYHVSVGQNALDQWEPSPKGQAFWLGTIYCLPDLEVSGLGTTRSCLLPLISTLWNLRPILLPHTLSWINPE